MNNESQGMVVWFTGLSGSGKTTIADSVHEKLLERGFRSERLDGDLLRAHHTKGLGFSLEDREKNIEIAMKESERLARDGSFVLASFVSPYRRMRERVRENVGLFVEVYVNAPLSVCEERDVKGLYKKARAGEITGFTGIDDPYEPPESPEIELHTDVQPIDECASIVFNYIVLRIS